MPRLRPLSPETMTEDQKAIVGERPSRALHGPHTVWLRRPELAKMASHMMRYLRRGGLVIPPNLTELAILVAAREFKAQFAWQSHARQALEAGVDHEVIEAIRSRRTPVFSNPDEALLYTFAIELIVRKSVSDDTYRKALELWGEDFLIDLVNLLGCYMMIAANLVAFDVEAINGEKPLD